MSEAVATRENNAIARINNEIKQNMQVLARLLPKDMEIEQFRAATWLEVKNQYRLDECFPDTVVECVIKSATFGLLPGRDCHFLAFRDNKKRKGYVATFVPNYFGIIRALDRTGKVAKAFAHPVYLNDAFEIDYFADRPVHKPAKALGKQPGPLKCFYGAIILKDGTCHFEVMDLDDIDRIKKRAPAHESGPWVTDFDMMARKTCIKRVAKYVQLTPDQRALIEDDDDRLLTDIPAERVQQNIADMYGDDMPRRIPDMTAVKGSPGDLNSQEASEPGEGVKNAPETNMAGMDWREPLSAGLAALDEIIKDEGEGSKTAKHLGATLQEAADMLQTADVPDEEGQAMLQRIRAEVAALTGQDSFAL